MVMYRYHVKCTKYGFPKIQTVRAMDIFIWSDDLVSLSIHKHKGM